MKTISIITPVYNEYENLTELVNSIKEVARIEKDYLFEHIIIDNDSSDHSRDKIAELIKENPHLGAIYNRRNFGQLRSPFHALLSTNGDAVILMCADLQEPPELIHKFLREWEKGYEVVAGVRSKSKEGLIISLARKAYYYIINSISDYTQIQNFTGFALYDASVINEFRKIPDTYPYTRGLITDLGYKPKYIFFEQGQRKGGKSKNNYVSLFDYAIHGITANSKLPIRALTLMGLFFSSFTFLIGIIYLIAKLLFWDSFYAGLAPLIIITAFGFSIVLFFLGLIGEYVASIHTQILNRPRVTELERINLPCKGKINQIS